ncbi:proline-rich protein 15 [Phascolarctos cinereus]|uniref:Proline-rich protein 15 n=1 Tax=Phascolarctos cinereus TaxID=38626 RepID=A0A6P5L061_PHACI|nr:proline-rich protein 15 [Phascolarctos cinereus]XP_020849041.1 proline-rich protein 15 [Phascolarctos cinereus]
MAYSGGSGGGSSSSSGSWWKSFANSSWKKGKDSSGGGSAGAQPPSPAGPQPGSTEPSPPSPDCQHPGLPGTADPRLDRLGEEKSGGSRRNLKISRSGRFKEKRKVRATLLPDGTKPQEDSEFPCAPHDDRQ